MRRQENEFRAGAEVQLFGTKLNVLHGWDNFKDDSPLALAGSASGSGGTTALSSFRREEPYHGNSPYWRVFVMRDTRRFAGFNGRLTYSSGRRNFILDESAAGLPGAGVVQSRQVYVFGDARRPFATGALTVTLFPSPRWTVVNQTDYQSLRMEGDSAYRELDNANLTANTFYFQYLGIRTLVNTTDVNFRAFSWLSMHGGYHLSQRRIRSVEAPQSGSTVQRLTASQDNTVHSGVAGFRLQPAKPLTLVFDGEIDRASQPFYPISDRNYHALSARARYKVKTLSFSGMANAAYNTNPVAFSAHSLHSRNYSADISWTPGSWFSLDTAYSKIHLNTLGGLAYFASGRGVGGQVSLYVSNIHTVNVGVRFALHTRADLYLGYSRVQDLGDGRSTAEGNAGGPDLAAFRIAQTFPLTYQSPLGRFSVRLHERLRWNIGYQYYGYRQRFFGDQNYRANTGYTSLLWSF